MDFGAIVGKTARAALGVLTGGLSDRVVEIVDAVTGGETSGLTGEQKASLKVTIEQEITKRTQIANEAASDAERMVTARAAQLEGTASDLMQFGIVGRLVVFLRGAQRPVWGFGTLYMDYMVFSGQWTLGPEITVSEQGWPSDTEGLRAVAFVVINILVLGFLFGERAVKNVMPLILAWLNAKRDK